MRLIFSLYRDFFLINRAIVAYDEGGILQTFSVVDSGYLILLYRNIAVLIHKQSVFRGI